MDHRLFAILVVACFALEGAGCASQSSRARREQIVMPLQTGSALQRRVMVDREPVAKKSKKKKKEKEKEKEKESKRDSSPKPTPAPEVTEEETPAAPDRFR